MLDKSQFYKKLTEMLAFAEEREKKITAQEVEKCIEGSGLSKEQMKLVYEYLRSQGIYVQGYHLEEPKDITLSFEEENYLKEYKSTLDGIKKEEKNEKADLFFRAAQGDDLAKGRLVELYLPVVVEIAREFSHPQVFLGDLIQEGNVSLLLAVEMIGSPDTADELLCREIRSGIENLLEEQTIQKMQEESMVHKVKRLEAAIRRLSEEAEKQMSVEELSLFLEMSEEEISDVLRLTGEGTK